MLAGAHWGGHCWLPCSGHDSAQQAFARILNQKGRASSHRPLASDHRLDGFLRKDARASPTPSCLPWLCWGLVLHVPARAEEKRLPVTPHLGLGPTALQSQCLPPLRKARGHLSYTSVTQLRAVSMFLRDPLATMGYTHLVGARSPKPRATSFPG